MINDIEEANRTTAIILRVIPRLARMLERGLARSGSMLSLRQLRVLQRLHDGEQIAAEMARETSVGPAAMQGVLDNLVQHGYVRRERSLADRRKQVLQLTPEGEAELASGNRALDGSLRALLFDLSPDAEASLLAAMELLQSAMDRAMARRRLRSSVQTDGGEPNSLP